VKPDSPLADAAVEILRKRLPPAWTADLVEESSGDDTDLTLNVGTPGVGQRSVLVEVKKSFRPADLDALVGGLTRRLRAAVGATPIVLISEYLSPRSRELLTAEDVGYIDLSGNVRLVIDYPGLFVESIGAERGPSTTSAQASTTLRGALAGRLVRFLADVRPPYRVDDIASATGLSRGYISRLLEFLADEALITRAPRGPVLAIDWPALLRRRAQLVDLLKTNNANSFIAPNGARAALEALRNEQFPPDATITGSFGAYRRTAVAAPTLLAFYTLSQSAMVRTRLGLLPADEGFDVVVLRPPNDIVFHLCEVEERIRYAAPSQIAIDCLSGPGRMPSEGEALMEWMADNEDRWRKPDIDTYMHASTRN
jgi:hypothetical protein